MEYRPRRKVTLLPGHGLDKLGIGVLLYAHAVMLGAFYLFSYWRPFGFDVFPYLVLQDYVSVLLNRIAVLMAMPIVIAILVFSTVQLRHERLWSKITLYLFALYAYLFVSEYWIAISSYVNYDFFFENEKSVLVLCVAVFFAAVALMIYCQRTKQGLYLHVMALIVIQLSVSLATGYRDGKAIHNGALQVYFLENEDLCEPGALRDWVLIAAYKERTFFMNTIDKRLCATDEKKIKLISRQIRESQSIGAAK